MRGLGNTVGASEHARRRYTRPCHRPWRCAAATRPDGGTAMPRPLLLLTVVAFLAAATLYLTAPPRSASAAAGADDARPAADASRPAPPEGFVSLFNGRDFTGWKVPEGDGGHWKVADGVIDYDARSEAKGDKNLWTERKFGDFILKLDWRIKETPYVNPNVPYILPDGTHAKDIHGKELKFSLPDSDSGIFIRGSGRHQVNIWCWPIGSGEMYGVRMDRNTPPELRAAVTPRTQADKPVGEWNQFEITVRGKTVKVVLNGKTVVPEATLLDLPARGPVILQHHGGMKDGKWNSPPSLVQFRNIFIKELSSTD